MLTVGQFIGDGRYEIIEKIGSGGMADVYKAKCHKLNRYVAIKVLKQEYAHDREFVNKFREEAQSAACLSHPNIVGIFDVVEENSLNYIVMEFVDGITLKQYIAENVYLSQEETLQIALQIAQGLSAAHDRHIVHRDIKPQNILLGRDNVIKVADFGIARAASRNTVNAMAVGSVHYFSPEQARGEQCDERTDIYSLGITMFEMLTGQLPFQGDTSVAVALAHITNELPSIDSYVTGVSEETKKIVKNCTGKKPEQRYLTVYDLIADLKKEIAAFSIIPAGATATEPYPEFVAGEEAVAKVPETEELPEEEGIETTALDKIILGVGIGILTLILIAAIYLFGSIFDVFGHGKKQDTTIGFEESDLNETVFDASGAANEEEDTVSDEKVKMPDVVGMTLEKAAETLKKAGLRYEISTTMSDYSQKIPVGSICAQEYKKGKSISSGTKVKLGVSLGNNQFEIKEEYIGMQKNVFEMRIANKGINVNYVEESNESMAAGQIISMDPDSGFLDKGDSLTVYVSTGPTKFKVANVVGMTEELAKTTLKDSGMSIGNVSGDYSDSVAEGNIISQSPEAGSLVVKGTAIDLVISRGPRRIAVPDLTGRSYDEAEALLRDNGLEVGKVTKEYSSSADKDVVIGQGTGAGTEVTPGTKINLVISQGSEKAGDTEVLLGMKEGDAKKKLESMGLKYGKTTKENSNSVAEGCVIRVERAEGSGTLYKGDTVNLVVSSGAEQKSVPNVVGKSQNDAKSTLTGQGFSVNVKEIDGTEAAGTVVDQLPAGGKADAGSTVTITVSKGNQVVVPNLVGMSLDKAKSTLSSAGLSEDGQTHKNDNAAAGTVIDQSVPAGTVKAKGSGVSLTISDGPAPETEAEQAETAGN